jgi:hypothetical protein
LAVAALLAVLDPDQTAQILVHFQLLLLAAAVVAAAAPIMRETAVLVAGRVLQIKILAQARLGKDRVAASLAMVKLVVLQVVVAVHCQLALLLML